MDKDKEEEIPFLSLKEIDSPLADELAAAARSVIESGRYLHGEETSALEREFCALTGMPHSIGVSNGLDALRLIFRAAIETGRLTPGDSVLLAANTYIATLLPVTEFGLKPILVEPNPVTFGIDWNLALRRARTPEPGERIKALVTTHLYGNPSWDEAAAAELSGMGIFIVEDNAQAIGATASTASGPAPTGGLGDAAAFSFYPTKNIGALGDAGAVTTRHSDIADAVRALANYGCDRRYHNIYRGYNCRLDEIQAAFLRVKLRHLPEIIARRQEAAQIYLDGMRNPLVALPALLPGEGQVWHQFVVRTPHRDALRRHLDSMGVATDVHYAVPPHLQPCYAGQFTCPLPLTETLAREVLSLPIAGVSAAQARRVCRAINEFRIQDQTI